MKIKERGYPSIFDYLNYREWLQACFDSQKKSNPVFSHQYFANKAGFKSSGYMLHVMKGERNLTRPALLKISRVMALNKKETSYLEDLVAFDRAKSKEDKHYYYARLLSQRKSLHIKSLEDAQYRFYSQWHHSVIRELITLFPDSADTKRLGALLSPPVKPKAVAESLALLEELGLIVQKGDGYQQTDSFISAGGKLRDLTLIKYQQEILKLAGSAWERNRLGDMSMNTMTLCMPNSMVDTLRQEIRKFKKHIFKLIDEQKAKPDQVFQFNLSLYPASRQVSNAD